MQTKFYVVIHLRYPAFILGPDADSIDPMAFDTYAAAETAAQEQRTALRVGYTILEWHEEQGGDGIVAVCDGPNRSDWLKFE